MRATAISEFQSGDQELYYRSAVDYIPKNLQPYYVFEPLLTADSEVHMRDVLLQGVSGKGMEHDPTEIRKGVFHSLKDHPDSLHMYVSGKV